MRIQTFCKRRLETRIKDVLLFLYDTLCKMTQYLHLDSGVVRILSQL